MDRRAQIATNPHRITLHNRGTLLITDRAGSFDQHESGLYWRDTRHLSAYQITINEFVPTLLSTVQDTYYSISHTFTNQELRYRGTVIPTNGLFLRVDRAVGDGLHEDISLTNFAGRPVEIQLLISLDADFADLMQVRGFGRLIPRLAEVEWDDVLNALTFHYRRSDFARTTTYRLIRCDSPPRHLGRTLAFEFTLAHGVTWQARTAISFDRPRPTMHLAVDVPASRRVVSRTHVETQRWAQHVTRIHVPDPSIQATIDQAVTDLASLQFLPADGEWFPAGGVPWFVATFGRDSIWASLQSLLLDCHAARGALARLAALQSDRYVPERDQEPGKIPHEVRLGELTHFGELPFSPYYGTADASLLYVILLAADFAFTGDMDVVMHYLPVAERCLDWAANWGDADGDGFVEYFPHGPKGYHNQGWKDAADAIVYPNGVIVPTPIALCEIQGYYYAALRAMAHLLRACGHDSAAATRDWQATQLCERFQRSFWMSDLEFYALGLDPAKQPIRTVASNAGQLLWSGITTTERATSLVHRLLTPAMFSGWGVRTLSAENPAFDPIAYQTGSVWPHDNGIIAYGMKRYGYWRESNRIARAIFDAAARFEHHSLPELFAGLPRQPHEPPVPYVDANVPQAWAAGSVVHLLRAMLGLKVDAASSVVTVVPALPDWLPELELRGFVAADTCFDLRFTGPGPATRVEVLRQDGPARLQVRQVEP